MQCRDEAAFDADRALAGGPGFAIGCDDAARPRRFGDGRAEGGVGRADLIGMDHALAVEPEFAPLTAGGGKALGIGEVEMNAVEDRAAVRAPREEDEAERSQ